MVPQTKMVTVLFKIFSHFGVMDKGGEMFSKWKIGERHHLLRNIGSVK